MATRERAQLLVQDCVPPQANQDPNTADWLPDYVGFSWIAYGAGSSLVISMAPHPSRKEEAEIGPFLRQVIHTHSQVSVPCVRWAPSDGLVAASAGECVQIFGPQHYADCQKVQKRGLPISWNMQNILTHTFQILSFTWTQSGDGLLSAGLEVNMWKRDKDVWSCLWKVPVANPHSLAAATRSVIGLTATAEATIAELSTFAELQKGVSKVWSWDGSGIQSTRLIHPQKVTAVQWRPILFTDLKETYRDVLLTSCQDGAVRLWIEIQTGRMKGDKASKKDGLEKRPKPSFAVAAVIETERLLKGILGTNAFVTWVFKGNPTELGSALSCKSEYWNSITNHHEVGICEWILGIGSDGSLVLWAIFCLDDLYPPRFPRVFLWKQATCLVPFSRNATIIDAKPQLCLILMKAVASRMGNKSSDPPVLLDLFCKTGEFFFEWFRIWPPVTAIEGGSSNVSSTGSTNAGTVLNSTTIGRNSWGITSKHICTIGHVGSVLAVAIHPAAEARLAASLDSEGFVLVWSIFIFPDMGIALSNLSPPVWRPCGRVAGRHEYISIAWLPTLFSGNNTLLLLGHLHGIDCFLIAESKVVKGEKVPSLGFSVSFLSTLDHCTSSHTSLQKIWVFQIYKDLKFGILGLGQDGSSLLSWKLDISTVADYKNMIDLENSETKVMQVRDEMIIKASSLRAKHFEDYERVLSLDVVPSWVADFPQCKNLCMPSCALTLDCAYNFVTGSVDGWLRLWKLDDEQVVGGLHTEDASTFQLVGGLKVCQGPIEVVAVANGGIKIAAISPATSQGLKSIHIWDVETYLEGGGGFTLDDRIPLDCSVPELAWLETGNGVFFLGVTSDNDILVYTQAREAALRSLDNSPAGLFAKPLSGWCPFASASTKFVVRSLIWGMNATLIVGMKDHLCMYSQKILLQSSQERKCNTITMHLKDDRSVYGISAASSSSWISPSTHVANSTPGYRTATTERVPFPNLSLSTILKESEKASSPLPAYHPWAILYHLSVGNQFRARICIRHFIYHVKFALACPSKTLYKASVPSLLEIPKLHLSAYFQDDTEKQLKRSLFENSRSIFNESGSILGDFDKGFSCTLEDTHSTDTLWLEFLREHLSPMAEKKEMKVDSRTMKCWGHDVFLLEEVKLMTKIVDDCKDGFPLPDNEKMQLLAAIDLIGDVDSTSKSQQYASLDKPGKRYWLAVEHARCYLCRRNGEVSDLDELTLGGKAMAWALQSDCKETLLHLCLADSLSWPAMRALGVGFWLTDTVQLRTKMEKLARAKYLLRKDPKDCALLYVALKRQNVLMGLFKLSKDDKDKALVRFLARNFSEERNQAAALKNAYVLMGKHQHELAAAFFLLGGDVKSAVHVCVKNIGDLQLAFVICRLKEGCIGEIELDLIANHALPNAKDAGDSWLASLFQWLSGDRVKAIEELTGKLRISSMILDSSSGSEKKVIYSVSSEKVGPIFLDPDAGHYCLLLATKPSVRAAFDTPSVLALSKWLTSKTANALRKIGLPLEALEQLSVNSMFNHGIKVNNTFDAHPSEEIFDMSTTGIKLREDLIPGYVSPAGAAGILNRLKDDLALCYVSQLLQDHPHWSYESCSNSESMSTNTKSSNEHDKLLSESLLTLEKKFSINVYSILARLAIFAQHQNRWFLYCRLLGGINLQTKYPEYLPSDLSSLPLASYILGIAYDGLTTILVRRILTCHDHVIASLKGFCWQSYSSEQTGLCLSSELQETVLLAYDLKLLAAATSQQTTMNEVDNGAKWFKAFILLVYIACVAVSWQGKQMRALLMLIGSITQEMPAFIHLSDVDKILDAIYSSQYAETYVLETEAVLQLARTIPKGLSAEDLWLLLGVSLWQRLLEYVKKHLVMVNHSASFKSFGLVSLLTSPSRASCIIPCSPFPPMSLNHPLPGLSNHVEEPTLSCRRDAQNATDLNPCLIETGGLSQRLVKSLTCIYSGLCRQLAYYLRHPSGNPATERLAGWILDIHHDCMETLMNSSPTSDQAEALQNDDDETLLKQSHRDQLRSFEKLWELFVDRDNISRALEMEGIVISAKKSMIRESTGCSRKNTESGGHKFTQSFTVTCKQKENRHEEIIAEDAEQERISLQSGCSLESSLDEHEKLFYAEKPKDILHVNGELFEAMCINSCCPDEVVIASNVKRLIYVDLKTGGPFSESEETLWCQADWPRNGWAKSESTPVPTFVSPGVGLGSKGGGGLGLGGATVGLGTMPRSAKDLSLGGASYGVPGYAGIGALGLGWEELEEFDGFVDPPATTDNVSAKALASHPLRPLFLVGSSNTHVYLWQFGQASAVATYGVLPAANVPPPYALASVSAVQFDRYGHRFATAAVDGTVCTWQLEVGGRSNVRPTECHLCFDRHASDVAFMGASGGILAATGMSPSCYNLAIWDTLAPPNAACARVLCHQGGARCLTMFDHNVGCSSVSPLIVTGGKGGDVAVHDFRFIATGKGKRQNHTSSQQVTLGKEELSTDYRQHEQSNNGMLWYIPKAHSASITAASAIPGTSLFLTGSKDGDVKLWDVKQSELVHHWHKVHEKQMFLQHNSRGFGAVVQASVISIQPLPSGFLTCGGDGMVKLFQYRYPGYEKRPAL